MKKTLLGALALIALPVSPQAAPGDAGDSGPNPGIPQERRLETDVFGSIATPNRAVPQGVQIDGRVVSRAGRPLGNVLVKLFSNGVVRGSARTAADGAFALEANPAAGTGDTTVLWFESPSEDLLHTHAVLHESNVARDRGLFPACVQRIVIAGSIASVEVVLMTEAERMADLKQSGCLERGR
jgi:hypothetical protein